MIQIIDKEWEITKTYIFEVVLRDGVVNLNWSDFAIKAIKQRPFIAIKVDEPFAISVQTKMALDKIKERCKGQLSSVIVVVSYKANDEIIIDELFSMHEYLSHLADKGIEIVWGLQPMDELTYRRSVSIFAFENENKQLVPELNQTLKDNAHELEGL